MTPMNTLLRTTIAGSLPKPAWLAEPEALWAPWRLEGAALAEGKRDAVRLALRDQEQAGIDIVSRWRADPPPFRHDVHRRRSTASTSSTSKTVRIRNRYDAAVPVVVGRSRGGTRCTWTMPRSCARRRPATVKYTLPGPMTMVDTLHDAHYGSREKLAWAFAEILNEEARAIAAAGVDVIQFDEPAFNVYFDEVRDWGVAALERAAAGLDCTTAVHICYGYGIKANIEWKKTLGRRMATVRADVSRAWPPRRSIRCRSNARIPTFRST